ncbi:MAG: GH32 C-terminal domain-containing protein, partial [Bacteroidota bacterium]
EAASTKILISIIASASVELFADGGRCVMTDIFFPRTPYTSISLECESPTTLVKGEIYPLERIWPN